MKPYAYLLLALAAMLVYVFAVTKFPPSDQWDRAAVWTIGVTMTACSILLALIAGHALAQREEQ